MLFCKQTVYKGIDMGNFGIRLKTLCIERGVSQKELAEVLGVSRQTVYLWTKGLRKPDRQCLEKIAAFFKVTVEYLLGEDDSVGIENKEIRPFVSEESEIPNDVVSIAEFRLNFSAGNGTSEPTWEELNNVKKVWYGRDFFIEHRVNPEKCTRATVYGDSMEPLLHDGDKILFVETPAGEAIRDGNIYVISINGALKVKRLSQKTNGQIIIKSDNPDYSDEIVDASVGGFYVLGRVIEVTHQL